MVKRTMQQPILVLQYPDGPKGKTVALAATRNPHVVSTFKDAVIEDARRSLKSREDELLILTDRLELERLQQVLGLLSEDTE